MPSVGDIVGGRYELIRLIGRGGMGEIYEAAHRELGARVALKFLSPKHAGDDVAMLRLKREAQAASAVGHDAIIRVHDLGESEDGGVFIVMELLDGHSLGERLGYVGRLDIPLTAYIVCQILSGLAAVHAVSIVHRDLKSDNVFLAETGAPYPAVKILDFGISRILDAPDDRGPTRVTQTGVVIGTPAYMSPEQARGDERIDHRSDLWSVGVVLHECLTGQVPFLERNYNATCVSILTKEPTLPGSLREGVPAELDAIVARALTKDRDERYQTASAMLRDLLPFVEQQAVGRIAVPDDVAHPAALRRRSSLDAPARDTDPSLPRLASSSTGLWWENDSGKNPPGATGRWRLPVVAAAILVVLAGAATGIALWHGAGRGAVTPAVATSDPGSASRPSEPPATSEAPADSAVTVTLEGVPEGARVFLDDALVEDLPLRLARDAPMYRLRIEAEGYEPYTRMLGTNEDRTLEVEMVAEVRAPAKAPVGSKSPVRRPRPRPAKRPAKGPGYFVPVPSPRYLED